MNERVEKDNISEDPVVMYLVVHEIGMSAGKMAAQVGHAVGMLYIKQNEFSKIASPILVDGRLKIWEKWQNNAFRKVVLTANDSKWNKLKKQLPELAIEYVMVVDAGFTEIPSGSETVIGIYPMYKSNSPPILRKLQLLK